MDTIKCIKTRRSKRKFLDKDISDEFVGELIDCARCAPFGGPPIKAPQLWEFIIVRDKEIKEKLALDYKDRQYIKQAPVIIAVCADKSKDLDYKDYNITASLAIQNILLAAHSLDLGACFVSTFHHRKHKKDREILIKALGLPKHIELIALIPIGWPDLSEKIEK